MNWHLFTGFVLMTVILVLVPGPVVTLVISTGATRGVRAGLVTVGGTSSGNAVLVTAIAFGLNWVLGHALYLFELLRWAGAAYLIWLGVKAWRGALVDYYALSVFLIAVHIALGLRIVLLGHHVSETTANRVVYVGTVVGSLVTVLIMAAALGLHLGV